MNGIEGPRVVFDVNVSGLRHASERAGQPIHFQQIKWQLVFVFKHYLRN